LYLYGRSVARTETEKNLNAVLNNEQGWAVNDYELLEEKEPDEMCPYELADLIAEIREAITAQIEADSEQISLAE
jgi:hypothetical protein